MPDLQEISVLPCDTGSALEKLVAEFDPSQVDLDLVGQEWTKKETDLSALEARAKRARLWLRELGSQVTDGDAHIVVVTHGGFVHFLTQDWDGIDPPRGRLPLCHFPLPLPALSSAFSAFNFI